MILIEVIEQTCYIKFKYNKNVIELIKQIPGRYYNSKNKTWEINLEYLPLLENKLIGYKYQVLYQKSILSEFCDEKFEFKTNPYEHQLECFEYAKKHLKFIIGDEMGLGKTKESIDIAVFRAQHLYYNHCLVVCGVNGLKWNWVEEIKIHSNEEGYILGERERKKSGKKYVGGNKEKIEDITYLLNGGKLPYFLILNIEALRNSKLLGLLKECIKKELINMIIFDEFHKAKNPKSKQGKSILDLKTESQIALSGTPLLNSPLELYSVLNWVGVENRSSYHFIGHYCIYDMGAVVGFRNLEQLQRLLSSCMIRRKKEDVLDLPPKIYVTDYVEMDKQQESIYNEIRQGLLKDIDKIVNSINPLAEFIRLRQATGFTGILSTNIRVSCKYDRLMDIIEETTANGNKVVVYSNWVEMLMPIFKVINEEGYSPALVIGETKQPLEEIKRFQENDNCKVILGTIGSMGTGYSITKGNVIVFLDEPWNDGTKEQAIDRSHRIGTSSSITIITLVAKDTIDERVREIVYTKGVLSEFIVDGKVSSSTNKRNLVERLLS